jgi:peptidyl-prolyl cis-trans isomerase SurA
MTFMKLRAYLLWAACAAQALALQLPAAAQGFRITPPLGSRSAAPAGERGPRAADYIVAVVNSEPITNNEVRLRMSRIEQQLAQQGQPVPPRGKC